MAAPAQQAKICVVCGKDCSTIDRIKDAEGRYTCKPCHDGAAPDRAKKVSDKEIAALYERPKSRDCPQCAKPVPADAEICVACGYNLRAGKPIKTGHGMLSPAAAAMAEARSKQRAKPRRWILAGSAAGVLGAGAWAAYAYSMTDAAPWLAIIAGAFCGLGVFAAAREHCGFRTVLVSLLVAMVFGAVGKAGSAAVMTLAAGPQRPPAITLNDEGGRAVYAREVAAELSAAGKEVYWPAGFSAQNAERQEHFPPEVWQTTGERWERNGAGWQQQYITAQAALLQDAAETRFDQARREDFLGRFEWTDAVYAGIGLVLAMALGAGLLSRIPLKR